MKGGEGRGCANVGEHGEFDARSTIVELGIRCRFDICSPFTVCWALSLIRAFA